MIIQCTICFFQTGNTYLEYLRIFLIFIPVSLFPVTDKALFLISLIYGAFGMAVLIIANFTSLFSGWDGNSISLNAFFAYTTFIIAFSNMRNPKIIAWLVIYSIIYYLLLIKFNSRSTIIFSVFLFLCVFSIIPVRKHLNKTALITVLFIPLFIAVFIVAIKDTSLTQKLNIWSLANTQKPIFNGRDVLWENGLKLWIKHPLFGTGNVNYFPHNSAIACLVSGGIFGYFILLYFLFSILRKGLIWLQDYTVFGLTIAFLTIWLQQSVELGLFSTAVNPAPYLTLALLYTRIKTLENNNEQTHTIIKHSNTNI